MKRRANGFRKSQAPLGIATLREIKNRNKASRTPHAKSSVKIPKLLSAEDIKRATVDLRQIGYEMTSMEEAREIAMKLKQEGKL